MQAGKLRHRLKIERPPDKENEYGEKPQLDPWPEVCTVWAELSPLTGRELWNAQQSQPDVTHRITIRYLPGITSKMRGIFKDRKFNFLYVLNEDERNIKLTITAMEQT